MKFSVTVFEHGVRYAAIVYFKLLIFNSFFVFWFLLMDKFQTDNHNFIFFCCLIFRFCLWVV